MSDYALFPADVPLKVEKFREIYAILEAVEVTEENIDKVADWCGGVVARHQGNGESKEFKLVLEVPSAMGVMFAEPGFYILKSILGHYIPYTNESFFSMYEKVT